jgi:hypothetical protein
LYSSNDYIIAKLSREIGDSDTKRIFRVIVMPANDFSQTISLSSEVDFASVYITKKRWRARLGNPENIIVGSDIDKTISFEDEEASKYEWDPYWEENAMIDNGRLGVSCYDMKNVFYTDKSNLDVYAFVEDLEDLQDIRKPVFLYAYGKKYGPFGFNYDNLYDYSQFKPCISKKLIIFSVKKEDGYYIVNVNLEKLQNQINRENI